MKRPIKAYACWHKIDHYRMVVFASNPPRARLLASQQDPATRLEHLVIPPDPVETYATARIPEADGLITQECVWHDVFDVVDGTPSRDPKSREICSLLSGFLALNV
jgi:hypothetical protein